MTMTTISYCPSCGYEVPGHAWRCDDCKGPLIESPIGELAGNESAASATGVRTGADGCDTQAFDYVGPGTALGRGSTKRRSRFAKPGGWAESPSVIPAWALPTTNGEAHPTTKTLTLRPMGVGEILDTALKLLRANARTMLTIVAVLVLPFEFLLAFGQRNDISGQFLGYIHGSSAASSQSPWAEPLAYAGLWVLVPLVAAAVSRVILAAYLGREVTAKDAIVAALKHAPALLVASLIVHAAEGLGFVILVVPALFLMPLFVMTAPAIALENLGPLAGIRRSVRLTRARYWPTFWIAVLSGVLASFLNVVLGSAPAFGALFVGSTWSWVILGAGKALCSFVTGSLIAIVAALVYLDARARQEGFDFQVALTRAALDGRESNPSGRTHA